MPMPDCFTSVRVNARPLPVLSPELIRVRCTPFLLGGREPREKLVDGSRQGILPAPRVVVPQRVSQEYEMDRIMTLELRMSTIPKKLVKLVEDRN
jgi:hypothetical protein